MPNTPASNIKAYLSGYADGEGSFCVSFSPRQKLKTSIEVRPSFSVSQNGDRQEVLKLFQKYLDCGTIRKNPTDRTFKYEVRSIEDLMNKVIPFFKEYPLISSKKKDFLKFVKICQMIFQGKHKKKGSLKGIVKLSYQMNGFGARRYKLEEILSIIR